MVSADDQRRYDNATQQAPAAPAGEDLMVPGALLESGGLGA